MGPCSQIKRMFAETRFIATIIFLVSHLWKPFTIIHHVLKQFLQHNIQIEFYKSDSYVHINL